MGGRDAVAACRARSLRASRVVRKRASRASTRTPHGRRRLFARRLRIELDESRRSRLDRTLEVGTRFQDKVRRRLSVSTRASTLGDQRRRRRPPHGRHRGVVPSARARRPPSSSASASTPRRRADANLHVATSGRCAGNVAYHVTVRADRVEKRKKIFLVADPDVPQKQVCAEAIPSVAGDVPRGHAGGGFTGTRRWTTPTTTPSPWCASTIQAERRWGTSSLCVGSLHRTATRSSCSTVPSWRSGRTSLTLERLIAVIKTLSGRPTAGLYPALAALGR